MDTASNEGEFAQSVRGRFSGILKWEDLDRLWEVLRRRNDGGWYLYETERPPPENPLKPAELSEFLNRTGPWLKAEHEEEYCGIVYADDSASPSMVKIYDPHNLGVVCGYSDHPPLPKWILSRIAPSDLRSGRTAAGRWRRWVARHFIPRSQ